MESLRELHLFAGAGGGILGGMLLGHTCVCAVEIEPYCRQVLLTRQRDGILPKFPIWDDVRTFDGKPWRGLVDVVCGGFPCQDITSANSTGQGIDGERSGIWAEFARVFDEVRPRFALVENSPALTYRGLGRILGDLASVGMDARWGVFSACSVGAPHVRRRMFILAYSASERPRQLRWLKCKTEGLPHGYLPWQEPESRLDRVANGVANKVDRLAAIGNGQVPAVVKLAWETLNGQ